MYFLRTFVPTKVPKASAQCRLRARFSRSADSRRGYFYCPPQFFLYVTLTASTYLGCRVKPTFYDRTSRFDIVLEKCSCNNTVDVFCRVQFITLVLRGFIPHRLMRGVKPPRVGKARQQIHGKLLM